MNSFNIRDRETLEKIEETIFSPFATKSADGWKSRLVSEGEHPYRTSFQRDRDRIIHSRAFRRLKHKRQVFLTSYGDHYRTRLTHTLEVSQLSRTMARSLGLNEDLVEAIALGHDLGHTPFGHIGEVVLDRILKGKDSLNGAFTIGDVGGFKHNYQSVRIVDTNETKYDFEGLNLTAHVREGILKHTRLLRDHLRFPGLKMDGLYYELDNATTLEGQIVAICDEIAQRTHDLEDGLRAGYVTLEQVRELPLVQRVERKYKIQFNENRFLYRNRLVRKLVNYLVTDVLTEMLRQMKEFHNLMQRTAYFDTRLVWFSPDLDPLQEELDRFIMQEIISKAAEKRSDEEAARTIRGLYAFFYSYPNLLPDYRLQKLSHYDIDAILSGTEGNSAVKKQLAADPLFARSVCDHVAGMTDQFAELTFKKLLRYSKNELQEQRGEQTV